MCIRDSTNYVPVISQPSGHGGFQSEDQSSASVVESTQVGTVDAPGISGYMDHSDLATDQTAELPGDQRSRYNVGDVPVLDRREAPVVTLPEPTRQIIYPPYDGIHGLFGQNVRPGPRPAPPTTTTTTVTSTVSGSRPSAGIVPLYRWTVLRR